MAGTWQEQRRSHPPVVRAKITLNRTICPPAVIPHRALKGSAALKARTGEKSPSPGKAGGISPTALKEQTRDMGRFRNGAAWLWLIWEKTPILMSIAVPCVCY